ncbi:prephenate dehydrogenase [Rothia sp. CCM 9418]|uniref:prephenate dehydrogenase n=1 Tax=Rothia sp. CCM 9418 TaxID=3402661 RepID=UPI003AE539D9
MMSHSPQAETHSLPPVLIVGTGLLGASVGLCLRSQGRDVYLVDVSPTVEAIAEDIGAGISVHKRAQERGLKNVPLPQLIPEAPYLVVVAAPPDVVAQIVIEQLQWWPHTTVVDLASVKAPIAETVIASSSEAHRYVGAHPMAGRERSGPVAARAELFTSRPFVVCPHHSSCEESIKIAHHLGMELGSLVTIMDAQEHDRSVARISHVPQVMSSLLASRLQETPLHALSLAGQGLRDTVRIAGSEPTLWTQILSANAEHVRETLLEIRQELDRIICSLEDPQGQGARLSIAQMMRDGNAGVARIPGKHGGAPSAFSQIVVLVEDTPGTLAQLLQEIGQLGVNLEDLRLEHSPGQPVGMVELSVNPHEHEKLIEDLTNAGWKVVR